MSSAETNPEWRNFVDYYGRCEDARRLVIHKTLGEAYFFLQNQISALNAWNSIIATPSLQNSLLVEAGSLSYFSSHYNSVYNYMGDCMAGDISSLPENQNYRYLFQATHDGYEGLHRKILRYVFVGEEGLDRETSGGIISLDELHTWLRNHSSRQDGLIDGIDSEHQLSNRTEITQIRTGLDLVRYIQLNEINDKNGRWVDLWNKSAFGRFSEETRRLAIYKMVCGMAVIDELTQEATNLGLPIAADYRPDQSEDEYPQQPLTITELWNQAYKMLRGLADSNDELLQPLFTLEELKLTD